MAHSHEMVQALRAALVSRKPGKIDLDLVRSMHATDALAALVVEALQQTPVDAVVTWDDVDNVVLGYAVARELGVSRAYLQEDLGTLRLYGPDLAGAKVALVSVGWDSTHALAPLRNVVEGAGATVVTETAALSEDLVKELEAQE